MRNLSILGSTGSIGRSALSLVELYPERFRVRALAAGANAQQLAAQARQFQPELVAIADPRQVESLAGQLPGVRVLGGPDGVIEAAVCKLADTVVAGISGAAGLLPTYSAIRAGRRVALANKETLVMAGRLMIQEAIDRRSELLPVDSEHSALHQCLRCARPGELRRLILTASGGPFRNLSLEEMSKITVAEALNHPTWEMGPKITIDSATLMNKGLEVIEAHHLFGVSADRISVVIHPQSIVHSMVEFMDGNVLAQMSITDMRSAILYALSYPEKWESNLPGLDLFTASPLEFHPPDLQKFPCLGLAYRALEEGQTYPAALNAANEVAVQAFLEERLAFARIPEVIDHVLQAHVPGSDADLESILDADRRSREEAQSQVSGERVSDGR